MPLLMTATARRHATWLVLLVWVFANASGVANACLLQERTAHGHFVLGQASDLSWIRTAAVTHQYITSLHQDGARLSKAACLKVFEQGSQSPVNHPTDSDLGVGPETFDCANWAVVPGAVPSMYGIPDLHRSTAPPIRVRYVRLAL